MSRTYNKLRGGFNVMAPQIEHPILPQPVMNTIPITNDIKKPNHETYTEEHLKPRGKNFDPINRLRKVAMKSKKITYRSKKN